MMTSFNQQLNEFKSYLITAKEQYRKIKTNKKIIYYNMACGFDIETSSFYDNAIIKPENKRALMYAWKFGIEDKSVIGRTWEELIILIHSITEILELNKDKRLICYVHNLGFDFQFFRPYFEFERVFALDKREPLQAVTEDGIEFRCMYKLSGYALKKVAEHLTRHQVKKMVGDLDYKLIRTPLTPLTPKEYNYLEKDVDIIIAYIREEIEDHGNNITKIPLTKTGKVRNYCRNACLHSFRSHNRNDPKFYQYNRLMKRLTINSVLEYKMLRQAFAGGFTHGNHHYINTICENVASYDESSAYPYMMISQTFPMSKGELITLKDKTDFLHQLEYYHAVFTATFYDIKESFIYDHYLSVSKCIEKENVVQDNGRIVSAKKITILITDIDYKIIKETYKWTKMIIRNFRRYKRGFLPKDLINAILDLYATKTTLKGVEDKKLEYQNSKENLNGCYGMAVTDICREEIDYIEYFEDDIHEAWKNVAPDYEKMIEKYNKDKKRFLFYPWGIFVTAWARYYLWKAILHLKEDYRYSDTDSVKFVNLEKHKQYFINYNNSVRRRLQKIMKFLDIDFNKCEPKTIDGVTKLIGAFDYEGSYRRFKYLGAKRYLCEEWSDKKQDYVLKLTVSGVNKDTAIPYLIKTYKDNLGVFNAFNDGLIIPKGYTGKQIHTYIDFETKGTVRDYLGNEYQYHELSGIHLEDTEYSLSMSEEFLRYLLGVQIQVS